ncbi:MAG TPA: AAA family ATPase, partial [Candidatus Limnocylindria bacterium]|nr:AAA family ATPase [Candidatus Limnocylindria bacterium]
AMRDAMPALNAEIAVELGARISVNTGQAVAGGGQDGQFLVTGDTVNVAARLQQGADLGEVVVGALTESLTRAAIEYQAHAPIVAKGKAEPLAAFVAVRPRSRTPDQARGLPGMRAQLVGRDRELRLLLEVFARVSEESRAHLFTIVGSPGVGKSRLVGEALARFAAGGEAHVARGRCLPYGAGITYWPIAELVRQDCGVAAGDERDAVLAKLDARVSGLIANDADRRAVRSRLAVVLGLELPAVALPGIAAGQLPSELAWGIRRHLEALAKRRPTVIVIDDIQWAEAPLLAVLDDVLERAVDAPLLLVCIARPELLDRAGWLGGRANATLITLEPLSAADTTALVARLLDVDDLPAELRERIVARSEGNPLFCEEFVRMLIDEGRIARIDERWQATAAISEVRVPESVQAVIAARIDRLTGDEKRALQVASVIGERFAESQLRVLSGDRPLPLGPLRRKGFVREDDDASSADRHRFKHLLVRDVAYASLPKAERADLHDRFGRLLLAEAGDRRAEYTQIVAHHAERALALSLELRLSGPVLADRARHALTIHLEAAQHVGAFREIDVVARHLEQARAAAAALGDGLTAAERIVLATAEADFLELSSRYHDALAAFGAARDLALEGGRIDLAARAQIGRFRVMVWAAETVDQFVIEQEEALRLAGLSGEPALQLDAAMLLLEQRWGNGQLELMRSEGEQLLALALGSGDIARAAVINARLASCAVFLGDQEGYERYAAAAVELSTQLGTPEPPWLISARPRLLLMRGQTDDALAGFRRNLQRAEEVGDRLRIIAASRHIADCLLVLERYAEVEDVLPRAIELSVETGERWSRAELIAMRAIAAAKRGAVADAERWALEGSEQVREGDLTAMAEVELALGVVRGAAGRDDEADRHFRRSIEIVRGTEYTTTLPKFIADHAEYLERRGMLAESRALVDEAEAVNARSG